MMDGYVVYMHANCIEQLRQGMLIPSVNAGNRGAWAMSMSMQHCELRRAEHFKPGCSRMIGGMESLKGVGDGSNRVILGSGGA